MELTITITLEDQTTKGSFADELLGEIASEKKQLENTHKVNKEVTELHKQALRVIMDDVNSELARLGVAFEKHKETFPDGSNKYKMPYGILKLGRSGAYSWAIRLQGQNFKKGEFPSKYTTYNGEFAIQMCRLSSPCYSAGMDWHNVKVEDILDKIRHDVKHYITH